MKISTFILSFCGFCIFYICNADWIDELIENYLGSDYEDVAPFISSVTAGTEEFDHIVQELSKSKRKWWFPSPLIISTVLFILMLVTFIVLRSHSYRSRKALERVIHFLTSSRKSVADKEEIQTIVSEYLEKKLEQLSGNKEADDVPVKLLWKGGSLMESSMHCNIRGEPKVRQMQRNILQSKLLRKPSDSGGGEDTTLAPSLSETSTAHKMAEIRKLLESKEELCDFLDRRPRIDNKTRGGCSGEKSLLSSIQKSSRTPVLECNESHEPEDHSKKINQKAETFSKGNSDNKSRRGLKEKLENKLDSDLDSLPDEKLMNRIRLLESRLRLEELKNKNWVSRMSRAEDILQQLNKQVERIEETRPMGTLTETLKITSTVTNWPPSPHPRRNLHFTLVNQYPPFSIPPLQMPLSELIRKEIGLPASENFGKSPFQLPPTPQIPALPSPTVMPQSSFLSKFLCR